MKPKVNKPRPSDSFSSDTFRRHYLSALESGDDISAAPQEGTNLGRIFVFLLLLHVFIIGAVILFNLVSDKPANVTADAAPVVANIPTQTSTPAKTDTVAPPTVIDRENTEEYRVKSGQNLQNVMDATGASKEDIYRLNQVSAGHELQLEVNKKILVPKKKEIPAAIPITNEQLVAMNVVESTPSKTHFEAVQPAKVNAENPKSSMYDSLPEEHVATTEVTKPDVSKTSKPKVTEPKEEAPKAKPPETKAVVKEETQAPKTSPKVAETPAKTSPASKKTIIHEVKPKETFYAISRKYGVSVAALMDLNGIKNANTLTIGTKLKIPAKD